MIYVDAISKWFAATGLRVGWGVVPPHLQPKFKALIGHTGAWAPRPIQSATAWLLRKPDLVSTYLDALRKQLALRLGIIYTCFERMEAAGLPVEAIPPQGAIYLSVRVDLIGRQLPSGATLETNEDIRTYLLQEARLAVVPFRAFGLDGEHGWFRTSVGAVGVAELQEAMDRLEAAVRRLR